MDQEAMLVQELQRLERLDRELQLDDELDGEDTEMEVVELLAVRVRAARLAGA